jgi:hypothetical protein
MLSYPLERSVAAQGSFDLGRVMPEAQASEFIGHFDREGRKTCH